jgi:predicted PurR-regulated permease PerM
MNREIHIADFFFFALFILLIIEFGKIIAPWFGPILAAAVIGATFYPLHSWLGRRMPRLSASLRAAVSTMVVLVFFVVPLIFLGWAIYAEAAKLGPVIQKASSAIAQWRSGPITPKVVWLKSLQSWLYRAIGLLPSQFEKNVVAMANHLLAAISAEGAKLAQNILLFILHLLVMTFALLFVFRDGARYYKFFLELLPLSPDAKRQLSQRFYGTIIGITRGWGLTSFIQGILAMIGYFIAGISGAVILGLLTAVSGLVPAIGTCAVWIPIAAYCLLRKEYLQGGFLLGWCGLVVVGLIDIVIRPYLVGRHADLPIFWLFFALLGGLEVYGAKGLILAPLVIALLPVLIETYRTKYLSSH